MARGIELGLNRPEDYKMPEEPEETKKERPDFAEVGHERISRAKERVFGFMRKIGSGVVRLGERAAATPEAAKYYKDLAVDNTVSALETAHDKGGEIKDSIVDKIESGVISVGERTVEPVKEAYQNTIDGARSGYKALETRAVGAYNFLQEKKQAFLEARERQRKEAEHAAAREHLLAAARVLGKDEIIRALEGNL